jgi:ankyrin repeat protein
MKQLLITMVAVVLVGCGETQQSAPQADPVEPVTQAAEQELPTTKAPDISIHRAARNGDIEAVKQHLAAGTDVNAKNVKGMTPLAQAAWSSHNELTKLLIAKGADMEAKTIGGSGPLHFVAVSGNNEIAELLIANGSNVNAMTKSDETPLDHAIKGNHPGTAEFLRKHGGKTGEELKAKGK